MRSNEAAVNAQRHLRSMPRAGRACFGSSGRAAAGRLEPLTHEQRPVANRGMVVATAYRQEASQDLGGPAVRHLGGQRGL